MKTYSVRLEKEWITVKNATSYTITNTGDLTIYNGSVAIQSFSSRHWVTINEAPAI